jgi:RimJ/RimL family protein N-acetyltransferase
MLHLLESERLLLRPPQAGDICHFVPLLNDFAVSRNLTRVPHPYTEDDGCAYIVRATDAWSNGEDYAFVILRKEDGARIGGCGVHPARDREFGYWLGRPFWGKGYATEAAARMLQFAFDELGLDSLNAGWVEDNPASGHVLDKLGCTPAGDEVRECLSRGTRVFCHKVAITRAAFAAKHGRGRT